MEVHLLTYLLDTHLHVNPPESVEVVALVDGTMFRASIEWPAIDHFLQAAHANRADETTVRDVIYRNRRRIELAISAHLFAHGIPIDRRIVIAPEALRLTDDVMPAGSLSGNH
jgi:hypothetical protein